MSLFGESHREKECEKLVEKILSENALLVRIIDRLIPESKKVNLILNLNINNSIYQIMALSLATNQKVLGILGLVDQVTNALVTASFTGTTANSDTPAFFSAAIDSNGNVIITGVAIGSGNLSVATTASYTDSTGTAQTVPLTASIPVAITPVITADAVSLVVNFGTPTAQ